MIPDYYQRATLSYKLGTQMPLFRILLDKGILEPEPIKEVKKEAKVAEKDEETKAVSEVDDGKAAASETTADAKPSTTEELKETDGAAAEESKETDGATAEESTETPKPAEDAKE